MSINTHKRIKPNVLDDLESLIYTVLSLSDKPLPWHNLIINNYQRNEALLKMKNDFDIISHCGKKYEFLSKIYEYLRMIGERKCDLNFLVIYEILEDAKKNCEFDQEKYPSEYCFQ